MPDSTVLKPIPEGDRNLGGGDYFLLWAGAAVSLAEIWAGGALAPLGLTAGLGAILLGHLIGNTPLALGSLMGCREGLPSMALTRPALGRYGSYLATGLNVTQLVGWTAVMVWLGGQAAVNLSRPFGDDSALWWMILGGGGTTLWALVGRRFWKILHRVAVSALILMCLHMTWLVLRNLAQGWPSQPARADLGFGLGLDLVIAMPISWLPLAADYSRFARTGRGAAWGTWWGYLIVSSWMYSLGLAAALASGSSTPETMIMSLLAQGGWLAVALGIVILSTLTTTFLDVYSASISSLNLPLGLSRRTTTLLAGGLGTLLALVFSAQAFEPFLLLLGSCFCPLFGLVLADYFLLGRRKPLPSEENLVGPRFRPVGLVSWGAGVLIYRWALAHDWTMGASLPSFILAGLIYLTLARLGTTAGKG